MQTHPFGRLWPVSTLTLGGGGLGMLWGPTTFDECVATVHDAVGARAIAYGASEYLAGKALAIFDSKNARDATFESRDGDIRNDRIHISICDSPGLDPGLRG